MSLADKTYFYGKINIAGIGGNSNSDNDDLLQQFIDELEDEVRVCGLGRVVNNALQVQLDLLSPSDDYVSLPEPWKSLVLGKEYDITVSGDTVKVSWGGLLNIKATSKISLIADYIYWHWMHAARNRQGTSATVVTEQENSIVISNHDNMVRAWRSFIKLYGECPTCNYWHNHQTWCDHTTVDTNTILSGNKERTLKEFIQDQNELIEDTYADWTWKPFANQNTFGI